MKHDTWLLIANSSTATVLASDEHLRRCSLINKLAHPMSRAKGRDIMADDRGRTRPRDKDAVGGSAIAYKTTPHEVEAAAFSRQLADYLRLSRSHHEWRELVLVAPPHFLGLLREALDEPTLHRVRASIAKNYVDEDLDELLARVRDDLAKQ